MISEPRWRMGRGRSSLGLCNWRSGFIEVEGLQGDALGNDSCKRFYSEELLCTELRLSARQRLTVFLRSALRVKL